VKWLIGQNIFDYTAISEHLIPTLSISKAFKQLVVDTLKAYDAPDKSPGDELDGKAEGYG
jgi:hypothetical protein